MHRIAFGCSGAQRRANLIRPFTGWDMRQNEMEIYDRQVQEG